MLAPFWAAKTQRAQKGKITARTRIDTDAHSAHTTSSSSHWDRAAAHMLLNPCWLRHGQQHSISTIIQHQHYRMWLWMRAYAVNFFVPFRPGTRTHFIYWSDDDARSEMIRGLRHDHANASLQQSSEMPAHTEHVFLWHSTATYFQFRPARNEYNIYCVYGFRSGGAISSLCAVAARAHKRTQRTAEEHFPGRAFRQQQSR